MGQSEFDFGRRLDELTTDFVGREWLIETIDAFIAGDADRCLVIIGEVGIGKSALSARLVQLGRVHAHHFCVAREGGTLDPIAFSRSLGAQLAHSLPGFGEHLINQAPMRDITVIQEIKELKGGTVYGVYIDKFVVQARSADEAFQVLVREPLRSWARCQPPGTRVVLMVDALDEAARLDRYPNIADLIDTALDLPAQVHWVLTSRPDARLAALPGRRQMLLEQSAHNLEDIGAYVDAALAEPAIVAMLGANALDVAEQRQILLARSRGNFLYLKYVLRNLRDNATAGQAPIPPDRLPVGLDGVYREFLAGTLRRKAKDDWRRIYRPVLGVLAVAQEPLAFEQLVSLSGVDEQEVNDVLGDLSQFLDVLALGDGEIFSIYHTSFSDFLADRIKNPTYWIDPMYYHRKIVTYYRGQHRADWSGCDIYGLRYLPIHHVKLGEAVALCQLISEFSWLQAKLDQVSVNALVADFGLLPSDSILQRIGRSLRLSAHILAEEPRELASQLLGRLLHDESTRIQELLDEATATARRPYFRPLTATLLQDEALSRILAGHLNAVTDVAITPDGRRAVSASLDKTVKVWDLASGQALLTLSGHDDMVSGVAVTPDGRCTVSASYDRTLKVWDLASGRELLTLRGHEWWVRKVAVTPDGQRAISASQDNTLKVWDLTSGRELLTLAGHTQAVYDVAITPDGQRAVSASWDETLKVWDLASGQELLTLAGHRRLAGDRGWVNGVAITPDGRRALSASEDGTLKLWDLASGQELLTLVGHSAGVTDVAIAPNGQRAISASDDGTLMVWDLTSGQDELTLGSLEARFDSVTILPDGQHAVSASRDNTIKIWDLVDGKRRSNLAGHRRWVNSVAVTSDGRYAVSASQDKSLKVWDLAGGQELWTLDGHTSYVSHVAVTPDSRCAVSASVDSTLKVWDLARGQELHTLTGHGAWVKHVAITPDGRRAVSASQDKTLKVWDLTSGRELLTLAGHRGTIEAVAITLDGQYAVSASWDETLKVWNLATGQELWTLAGHTSFVLDVAITADGRYVVSASQDNTLKVWNLASGKELWTLAGHAEEVANVALTPNGRCAVSASADETLKIWDVISGQELNTLTGHRAGISGVQVTHEGSRAVSASFDSSLKVWDLASGACMTTFHADAGLNCLAITSDDTEVVTGADSGRLHFLRLESTE